jgi:hypothetical protein
MSYNELTKLHNKFMDEERAMLTAKLPIATELRPEEMV